MSGLNLAAFSDAMLEAASSKGLVRRAHRDVEAGLVRAISETENTATLTVDGQTVTITTGPLNSFRCSCNTVGLCRHRIAAVVFLRSEENHSPEEKADPIATLCAFSETDLRKAFGRAALQQAAANLDAAPRILIEDDACIIHFSGETEVRFVPSLGLEGIVSKATGQSRKPLHARAVLAVRHAQGLAPILAEPQKGAATQDVHFLRDAQQVLLRFFATAFSGKDSNEEELRSLMLSARTEGMPHLAVRLRQLLRLQRMKRQADPDFSASDLLLRLSRCYALTEALLHNPDSIQLCGEVRAHYLPWEGNLTLHGAGVDVWTAPSGARGATSWFFDGQAARWFSLSLARSAEQDPSFDPLKAAQMETLWGSTLLKLSSASVIAAGGSASAQGRLSSTKPEVLSPATDQAPWKAHAIDSISGLISTVRQRQASALADETLPVMPLIVKPNGIEKPFFDEAEQCVVIPIGERGGTRLALCLDADQEFGTASAERWQSTPPAFIIVLPERRGYHLQLRPIAYITSQNDVVSLAFAQDQPAATSGFLGHLKRRLNATMQSLATDDRRMLFSPPPSTTHRVLLAALDDIVGIAERGKVASGREGIAALSLVARQLRQYELIPLASLADTAASRYERDPAALLALAYGIALCLPAFITLPQVR